MAFNVETIRQDFPILQQQINGKPLVYLDNAATTQKPHVVIDAISNYYSHDNANVHRGVHSLSERATLHYENARVAVQQFINASSAKQCIFVRGCTEAINLVAQSFVAPRIKAGEEILITEMEHHSNIVPWQMVSKKTAANIRVVPIDTEGDCDLAAFEHLLTADTRFLSISHISNALGTINPIKEMIAIAHEHDVTVLIDGAQAAPHMAIDVQDLDCDFYAFSGHKMFGPTGIGVLYGKAELLDDMAPYQGGGEMITRVSFDLTEYAGLPYRFEAGTPNISGAIGLAAAIEYINKIGLDNIAAYERELLEYATQALRGIKGVGLIGTAKRKASLLTFVLQNIHAHDVGSILNSLGIAVRSGHMCAMPTMDHFQIAAATRAAFAFYNTKAEVDAFITAVDQVKEVFA